MKTVDKRFKANRERLHNIQRAKEVKAKAIDFNAFIADVCRSIECDVRNIDTNTGEQVPPWYRGSTTKPEFRKGKVVVTNSFQNHGYRRFMAMNYPDSQVD